MAQAVAVGRSPHYRAETEKGAHGAHGLRPNRWAAWGLGALLATLAFAACATASDLAPLRAQFQLPDGKVDYATAKLTVDRLIDPSTDIAAVRRQLVEWERAVRGNVPANPTARQVLDALLKTLYEPGPWNQNRPFTHDLDDPLGRNARNKQLATYLAARKGNWQYLSLKSRPDATPAAMQG